MATAGRPPQECYREVYQLLDKEGNGVTWDAMVEVLSSVDNGNSSAVISKLLEVLPSRNADGTELFGMSEFAQATEAVRQSFGAGTPEEMQKLLNVSLLHEIFRFRANKDGRIPRVDLKRYLESLPKKIAPADCDRYFSIADLDKSKYIAKDDFTELILDVLQQERPDITVTDYVMGGREADTSSVFEQIRARGVGRLFGTMKGAIGMRSLTPSESRTGSPQDKSFIAGLAASPLASPGRKNWGGRVREKLSNASLSSPAGRDTSPSPGFQVGCDHCGAAEAKRAAMERELADARKKASDAAMEVVVLKRRVDRLERAELNGKLENQARDEQRRAALEQLTSKNEALAANLLRLQAEADAAVAARDKQAAKLLQCVDQSRTLDEANQYLRRKLKDEQEHTAQLQKQRRAHADDDTRRKAELSKLKAEARKRDDEIAALRKQAEDSELEKRLVDAGLAANSRRASRRMSVSLSLLDATIGDVSDAHGQYTFVPQKEPDGGAKESTYFDAPGPIIHTFPEPIKPTELLFDVFVSTASVTEHVTLRDSTSLRSACLTFSSCEIRVPCTTLAAPLAAGRWHSFSVVFRWQERCFSVYLADTLLFQDLEFRDSACRNLSVFDAYPRNNASVVYANIRFLLPDFGD